MSNLFTVLKDSSRKIRGVNDLLASPIPFFAALTMQFLILLAGSLKGAHQLPLMGAWVVIAMDAFAVFLRLMSKRRFNPLIAYLPQTMLCFGICVQAVASAVGNHADAMLDFYRNVMHMWFGLGFFLMAFFFFGYAAWALEKLPFARQIAMIAMMGLPLLTVCFGTKQNDAKTSFMGVQIYQFTLVFLLFVISSIFRYACTPSKRAVYIIIYLAVNSALFFMMREFGTLLLIWIVTFVAILTDVDLGKLGIFSAGGFGFIGKIVSVPVNYIRSIPDRIIDRINPTVNKRTRRFIRRGIFFSLLGIAALTAVVLVFLHLTDIVKGAQDIYHRKVEMRLYPWLNIGNAIDQHQEALSKCFVNGGLFGKDIVECVFPPHFHEDATLAFLFELFGWFGGILFLVMSFVYLYQAHTESFRHTDTFGGFADVPVFGVMKKKTLPGQPVETSRYALTAAILLATQMIIPFGSAVKLLPIIGLSTPMLSGGGAQFAVWFTLTGIITSHSFSTAMKCAPELSPDEDRIPVGERIMRVVRSKVLPITLACVFALAAFVLFSVAFTLNRFKNYAVSKVDSMHRIEYQYDPTDQYAPPEAVADIPLPEDSDVCNVLLIGLDNASGSKEKARSDSMILISLNKKENTIKVFSLQRDTFVKFGNGISNKLNACYRYGGMQLLTDTIKMNYRIPIHYTASIDRSSFKKIINAMGGVELTLSKDEADYLNKRPKAMKIKKQYDLLTEGKNHLDGWQTLEFVRMRHSNAADNDYNRAGRQQEAIAAMLARLKKMVKDVDIKGLTKAIDAIAEEVDTNLTGEQANELLPEAAMALVNMMDADGKLEISRFHVPDKYHADNYFEYGAWRLKPDLRRTAKFLRFEMYGKDSLKGIE